MRSKLGACILRVERSMVGKCMHVLPYCTSMFVELTGLLFYCMFLISSTLHLSKRSFFIVNSNMGAI